MSEPVHDAVRIGIVSISDRASSGVYEDKGLPALQDWLTRALRNPITFEPRLIPDEQAGISAALIELVDAGCCLVLTTGGTGPALRDVTPEATLAVADKAGKVREVIYRLEAGDDTTVSSLLAVLGALGLALRLERAGLPSASDIARRFQEDDEDDDGPA